MSYLLYCIFREQERVPAQLPPGVDGQSVFVLPWQGLAAAVSEIADPQPDRTDFSHLLAYERAVAWFHRRRTVIPMRYGSIFAELREITGVLEEHREQYWSLLEDLDGLEEVGVRVLLEPPASRPQASGTAYLASRKEHYAALDRSAQDLERALHGLYSRSRRESCEQPGRNLLSLYFLVPRESVGRFCRAAESLGNGMAWKLRWSGPWPPYNFVHAPPAC